jgi:hypothetical protein
LACIEVAEWISFNSVFRKAWASMVIMKVMFSNITYLSKNSYSRYFILHWFFFKWCFS